MFFMRSLVIRLNLQQDVTKTYKVLANSCQVLFLAVFDLIVADIRSLNVKISIFEVDAHCLSFWLDSLIPAHAVFPPFFSRKRMFHIVGRKAQWSYGYFVGTDIPGCASR